jgi:hypothetical protein
VVSGSHQPVKGEFARESALATTAEQTLKHVYLFFELTVFANPFPGNVQGDVGEWIHL